MSDAKTPEQKPDPNQPAPATPSSWFAGWEEFSTAPDVQSQSSGEPIDQPSSTHDVAATTPPGSDVWDEWQTVDFPNAMSADALTRSAQGGDRPINKFPENGFPESGFPENGISGTVPDRGLETAHPTARTIPPAASPDTWIENSAQPDMQPNIGELISLIQELNQCNNALLDRVSQLEDALEQTQNATLAQNASVIEAIAADSNDLHALHDQVVALSSQLKLSQQISQRQQALTATLTQDLAASQARVTQLEQEYTLSQQRLNEQAQLLIQSESDCRDLRTRLQRQQRHTLQFKAALERCLDVPVDLAEALDTTGDAAPNQPWYEPQATLAVQSLLPKVQHIQPWSAKSSGSSLPLKLDALVSRLSEPVADSEPIAETDFADLQGDAARTAPDAADLAVAPVVDTYPASKEFPTLKPVVKGGVVEVPNPPTPILSEEEATSTHAAGALLSDVTLPAIPSVNDIIRTLIDPTEGSDAEATLWQELARLVNGSTDEIPEAGSGHQKSGRSEATVNTPQPISQTPAQNGTQYMPPASADSDADPDLDVDAPNQETNRKSAIAPGPLPIPPLVPTANDKRKLLTIPFESSVWSSQSPQSAAIASEGGATPEAAGTINPEQSGPSPLVYPERPAKKIQSLAAVDLPSFPR